MDLAAVAEADLDLGRMDVDVDQLGLDVDEQHVARLAVAVQDVVEGGADRVGDQLVAHVAAVDVDVLHVGAAAGGLGQADATVDAHRAHLGEHLAALRDEVLVEDFRDPLRQRGGAPLVDQLALVPDGEADVGPGQRVAAQRFEAMGELGALALQELAAGGRVEEQLADFDGGASSAGGGAEFAGAGFQAPGMGGAVVARDQGQFGDGRDGGEGFAAEAHRRDRLEVVQRADLAGGVAA